MKQTASEPNAGAVPGAALGATTSALGRAGAPRSEWRAAGRVIAHNRLALAALVFLVAVHLVAVFAPQVAPADPDKIATFRKFQLPGAEHLLGTDELGRDVLSRLIFGSRVSLVVGSLAMVLSLLIGVLIGAVAGHAGGAVDGVLMRFTDGVLTIPTFFLALITVTVFGTSIENIILVIALTSWMVVARVVRGEVLRASTTDYVFAARAVGVSPARLIWRHVLPSAIPSIIVTATLGIANAILTESALSYLGVGVQPPASTWGNMLSNAQNYLFRRPDLAIYPGALIFLTVLAYNFFGDALHDALDPRYRHKSS